MANTDHYGNPPDEHEEGHETPLGDMGHLVSTAEINQQIATAKRFPRFIENFVRDAERLVSLNVSVATQCTYALKRGGKTIEGPSARFAEIINSCYGNVRSAARVVDIGDEYITAEGICYDLEKNNAIRYEVMRRITDKDGNRYNADMIGVTGNAACSIAIRNAILKVIPKAFWQDIWEKARDVARGDEKTFGDRRTNVLETFKKMGVTPQQIYDLLGIPGLNDMTRDHMVTLGGILTAIKDGDTTVEQQFGQERQRGQMTVLSPGGNRNEFVRQQAQPSQQAQNGNATTGAGKPQDGQAATANGGAEKKDEPAHAAQGGAPEAKSAVQSEQTNAAATTDAKVQSSAAAAAGGVATTVQRDDALADWVSDKKGELAKAERVRDCNAILEQVLDELGEKHPAYLEFARAVETRNREIFAAQKGAKKR